MKRFGMIQLQIELYKFDTFHIYIIQYIIVTVENVVENITIKLLQRTRRPIKQYRTAQNKFVFP